MLANVPTGPDLYTPVHRGLRRALARVSVQLGATDWSDDDAATLALDAARGLLVVLRVHADRETRFIHPVAREVVPFTIAEIEETHEGLHEELDAIADLVDEIGRTPRPFRASAGAWLEAVVDRLHARELAHMAEEEREISPALREALPPERLRAIQGAIIGSFTPLELRAFLADMLPALKPGEREPLLAGLRAKLPPEVFAAVTGATEAA